MIGVCILKVADFIGNLYDHKCSEFISIIPHLTAHYVRAINEVMIPVSHADNPTNTHLHMSSFNSVSHISERTVEGSRVKYFHLKETKLRF